MFRSFGSPLLVIKLAFISTSSLLDFFDLGDSFAEPLKRKYVHIYAALKTVNFMEAVQNVNKYKYKAAQLMQFVSTYEC